MPLVPLLTFVPPLNGSSADFLFGRLLLQSHNTSEIVCVDYTFGDAFAEEKLGNTPS